MNKFQQILIKIIEQNPTDRKNFLRAKKNAAAHFDMAPPKNQNLIAAYRELRSKHTLKKNNFLEKILKKRTVRTASGIACVTVMTKQYRCPGRCIFCPQVAGMPKSYLPDQPAMMRAIRNDFDPYRQVTMRIQALQNNGHATDKIEIRIAGETWSAYPKRYQTWFIKRIFDALNGDRSQTLSEAHKKNETAKNRCVGMSIETRPDWINESEIKRLRKLGVTLVELGVQHTDNRVLALNHRDHPVETVYHATQLLRDAGFKIVYHTMPNLFGSTAKLDFGMHRDLFENQNLKPDQLKIYPCMLLKNTLLFREYEKGNYKPYTTHQLVDLLLKIKKIVPEYCRIIRVVRDIPKENIIAGNDVTNIRQLIHKHPDFVCRCVRCREPMEQTFDKIHPTLKIIEYEANNGREFFIAYEHTKTDTLFGYVRLRLPQKKKHFIAELSGAALIRELHVYGMMIPLSEKNSHHVQHKGLGKKLMRYAENLAKRQGYQSIAVISGIGVREYYREKLGYKLSGSYMVKNLS